MVASAAARGFSQEARMASKDKGGKATKTAASKNLKQKRQDKQEKQKSKGRLDRSS